MLETWEYFPFHFLGNFPFHLGVFSLGSIFLFTSFFLTSQPHRSKQDNQLALLRTEDLHVKSTRYPLPTQEL